MLVFYLFVFLISVYGLGLRKDSTPVEALSIEQCNAIKGISILLVFISHASQYVSASDYQYSMLGDDAFLGIKSFIGQLCVVMFFFYSGYGTEWSIARKGKQYVKDMPRRRVLTTLINFNLAVVVFVITNLLLGNEMPLKRVLMSLFAWDSVGNSEWYIFDILSLYVITYISSRLTSNNRIRFGLLLSMTISLIYVLYLLKGSWWYNTLLAYPAGVFMAMNKDWLLKLVKNYFWPILFGLIALFLVLWVYKKSSFWVYNAASIIFAFLIVTLTSRIRIQNRFLIWLGMNLFPLYIYQRLPMLTLNELCPSIVSVYPIAFYLISFLITVIIAASYKYWRISFR